MDGLTCNRLAVLGKPSSMGGCRSGAAVPIGSHQRKESTTEAIGNRHYWVTEGYFSDLRTATEGSRLGNVEFVRVSFDGLLPRFARHK